MLRPSALPSRLPMRPSLAHGAGLGCRQRGLHAALTTSTSAATGAQPADAEQQQRDLQEVLRRVRTCVQMADVQPKAYDEAVAHGTGKHLGSDVAWSFRWRRDGAFYEEVRSKHLTFKWGYDGGEHSNCWEVDPCGISKHLEYDDHESLLLAALVRSGRWLDSAFSKRLHLTLVQTEELRKALKRPFQGPGPVSSNHASRIAGKGGKASEGMIAIAVRLRCGKMVAKIRVCSSSWVPLGYSQPLCGDLEIWRFSAWKAWDGADLVFPTQVHHYAYAGGHHQYTTTSCSAVQPALVSGYSIPPCPAMPSDASFDPNVPAQVQGWQTGSGHMLVEVELDGKHAGLMILDTGASGFVVEQRVADELQLERFGELHIAAITGKLQTRFRRAKTLRIGPLTMQQPVLMEMPLAGLVKGGPSEVVGIIGYDVFRRAIVEIPKHPDRGSSAPASSGLVGTASCAASSCSSNRSGVAEPEKAPGVVVNLRAGHAAAPLATAIDAGPSTSGSKPSSNGISGGASSRSDAAASASSSTSSDGSLTSASTTASQTSVSTNTTTNLTSSSSTSSSTTNDSTQLRISHNADGRDAPSPTSSNSSSITTNANGSDSRAESGRGTSTSCPGPAAGSVALTLHSPASPPQFDSDYVWTPMSMIANLPHVELTFQTPAGARHTALFMIDSGAGGSDLMFHGRAARELGLLDNTKDGIAKTRFVKGVGGSDQKTMRVQLCELPWLEWGEMRFENVRALSATHGGLDISLYSAGIVCADLLMRTSVVLDYVHKRIGMRRTKPACC